MGPGTTIKNFEKRDTINANTEISFPLTTFASESDLDSSFRHFRYFKLISIAITQNNLNLVNEQKNCYVRIAWSNNYEEQEDIGKDDGSKILPNIGRKMFIFKPPNAQLPITINGQKMAINMANYQPTELLLDPIADSYQIPGSMHLFNDTTQGRYITMILRIKFRGSKVIDTEAESLRILSKKGYKIEKPIKQEENKKQEEEEEEYDDEEEQLEKWSQEG